MESVASMTSPVESPKTNSRAILASHSESVELPAQACAVNQVR